MEATGEAESLLDTIKPPRLEDAGLEDCALPPDSIKEAFLKAAAAVKSLVSASDDEDDSCVNDPRKNSSPDALVGITDGVTAPAEGCGAKKGGLSEAPCDEITVVGGGGGGDAEGKSDELVDCSDLPEGGKACVDGLRGLRIGEEGRGVLGKSAGDGGKDDDVAGNEGVKGKPTLAEGYV